MPAEAKPSESVSPLTWGQSSPSSGVISVSLWTTTLVTDMSGCCSLASLIAWASAYPQEITEGQRQKGGGTCMISSKVETHELDLYTQFTNEVQWLQKESYIVYWKVNSENCLDYMLGWKNSTGKNRANQCFSALLTGIDHLTHTTWSWSMSASPVMTIRFSILVSEMPPFTVWKEETSVMNFPTWRNNHCSMEEMAEDVDLVLSNIILFFP